MEKLRGDKMRTSRIVLSDFGDLEEWDLMARFMKNGRSKSIRIKSDKDIDYEENKNWKLIAVIANKK